MSGSKSAAGPVESLREVAFWLERSRAETRRVQAYRKAANILDDLTPDRLDELGRTDSWTTLVGIGPKTAAVAAQAFSGVVPTYLTEVRDAAAPIGEAGSSIRTALLGDLHTHSNWSDGGSPIDEMMQTARRIGHSYCVLTDHSPRLRVANGLSAERLREQLTVIEALNVDLAPFRILTGIEVDILGDGSLDQSDELLDELDVVVASVHSDLRADSAAMTSRMLAAVKNPRVDVLGHCTGRLVEGSRGTRPESQFDAARVFDACAEFGTAVEINSRPERRDPPARLITVALDAGALFSIDTDAHAPGQLDWQGYGCERAVVAGVPTDRIVNTWSAEKLLAWNR